MNKYKWPIIFLNLIFLLIYINYSIVKKEEILKNGQLVLLELAPVDPRSLMQGDYMALDYKISNDLSINDIYKKGYCVLNVDKNGITKLVRTQEELTPLSTGEHLVKFYTSGNGSINIGAESYFFQEGQSEKYEKAKYGGLKINNEGGSLLIGLYNQDLKKIE